MPEIGGKPDRNINRIKLSSTFLYSNLDYSHYINRKEDERIHRSVERKIDT